MFEVSTELRKFILDGLETIVFDIDRPEGVEARIPFISIGMESKSLLLEILKWIYLVYSHDFRKEPFSVLKFNIGPFVGIFPVQINSKKDVTFRADYFDTTWYKSWRSWFLSVEDA